MTNKGVFRSQIFGGLFGALVVSACGAAAQNVAVADPPRRALDPAVCPLDAYAPATVQPHYDREIALKTTLNKLHGADIYIPARPGLTAEWLRHELAPRAGQANCALGVANAEVVVASDGAGFLVTIRARDQRAGGEILRLARVTEAGSATADASAATSISAAR